MNTSDPSVSFSLLQWGIDSDSSKSESRITSIVNVLSLFLSILFISISILMLFKESSGHIAIRFFTLSISLCLVLFLNRIGQQATARFLFCLAPGYILFLSPIIINQVHEGMFLWMPYAGILFSIVPYLLFIEKQQRVFKWLIIGAYLLAGLFLDIIFAHTTHSGWDIEFLQRNYIYYKIPQFGFALFLHLIAWVLSLYYDEWVGEQEAAHKEMQVLQASIAELKTELKEKEEEITTVHENLEMILTERTKVIAERNQQIIEYAYFNAHQVRGPLARILGLVSLSRTIKDPDELLDIMQRIDTSAQELNQAIYKINKILEEDEDPLENDDFISN
ncbi:hypothetical protein QWY31_12050 [Cytophagales bacterium LB-30]|uniref:Uncharacterized protein n=1 Tax=Shiella aurantiaca TaxID=3058365 RepID=A0ABT8F7M6_9BACT|nr:hypothetical protein [Shiella aurantiaca]MDN4166239.1 hypothetical protein [Shiella aurantiaca]